MKKDHALRKSEEREIHEVMRSKERNTMSAKFVDRIKISRLTKLFDTLDSDSDGLISVHKIHILTLDNKSIDLLTPFLLYIEDTKAILTKEQFIE